MARRICIAPPTWPGERTESLGLVAGAGFDVALSARYAARMAYLYERFGEENVSMPILGTPHQSRIETHSVHLGLMVRTGGSTLTGEALADGPAPLMSGFRAGLQLGGGTGSIATRTVTGVPAGRDSLGIEGLVGGLLIGYDHAFGDAVVGIEADIGLNSLSGALIGGATPNMSADVFWSGAVRARAGYRVGRFLPYVAGGWAIGQIAVNDPATGAGNIEPLKSGWTAGGGVEAAISPDITARIDYAYTDLGAASIYYTPGTIVHVEPTFHQLRAGLIVPLGR